MHIGRFLLSLKLLELPTESGGHHRISSFRWMELALRKWLVVSRRRRDTSRRDMCGTFLGHGCARGKTKRSSYRPLPSSCK